MRASRHRFEKQRQCGSSFAVAKPLKLQARAGDAKFLNFEKPAFFRFRNTQTANGPVSARPFALQPLAILDFQTAFPDAFECQVSDRFSYKRRERRRITGDEPRLHTGSYARETARIMRMPRPHVVSLTCPLRHDHAGQNAERGHECGAGNRLPQQQPAPDQRKNRLRELKLADPRNAAQR